MEIIMQDGWYKIAKKDQNEGKRSDTWNSVESSFIQDIVYFEPLKTLQVRFKNGRIYVFDDVPEYIYKSFTKAKSKGAFFNKVIKKRFGRK